MLGQSLSAKCVYILSVRAMALSEPPVVYPMLTMNSRVPKEHGCEALRENLPGNTDTEGR